MKKNVIEAEVLSTSNNVKYKYIEKNKKTSNSYTLIAFISLLISFIPVAGLILSIFVLLWAIFNKYSKVIPVISLLISSLITFFFISFINLIRLILN